MEPLAAQGAAAADEVLFTAEQLAAGAAGAAEDASDAMTAAQRAAQRAVGDVANDASDAAAAAQRAAQRAADDVVSDATDAMTATQRAAERMFSDFQQQATQAAASAVPGTAEAAAAAAAEAAGAASAVAAAAGSAAAPARPQGQLSAPAGPAGSLSAPEPPAGSLSAPKQPAGELQAPHPPAGSLAAPEQPAASTPPPPRSEAATSSSSGASSSGSGTVPTGGDGSSGTARVGRGSGATDRAEEIAAVKQQLVSMLASLDRGAAATEDQAQRVDNLARRLEVLGGAVALGWEKPGEDWGWVPCAGEGGRVSCTRSRFGGVWNAAPAAAWAVGAFAAAAGPPPAPPTPHISPALLCSCPSPCSEWRQAGHGPAGRPLAPALQQRLHLRQPGRPTPGPQLWLPAAHAWTCLPRHLHRWVEGWRSEGGEASVPPQHQQLGMNARLQLAMPPAAPADGTLQGGDASCFSLLATPLACSSCLPPHWPADKSELDNVVELFLRFSLASLPGGARRDGVGWAGVAGDAGMQVAGGSRWPLLGISGLQ